ncbi:arylamine N-acetyltransferase [Kitasatospora sp. MMS16-BH015]|uniref:arylamine N-acetyltransferase family protein n=1 Tax=Kitasatospora sp. MMS16-BH015 TaxID=2018025 RepID=UPI000CF29621|nr:arylamine N-acetyltransferase [Kitasatospora sp. MMS16-BH015]
MPIATLPAPLTDRYLHRLGVPSGAAPSLTTLRALHRAHVLRVPFENLAVQFGRPTTVDPVESAERILSGRGGYCFHLNGAFAALLETIGYQVEWRVGGIHRTDNQAGASGDHLTLTVRCEGETWLVDVGLGQGFLEPLPLRSGSYRQGLFEYRIGPSAVQPGGWRLDVDPQLGYLGMDFRRQPASGPADFAERHEWLSTAPTSPFMPFPCAFQPVADGQKALRGIVLVRIDPEGRHVRELADSAEWFDVLEQDFGLTLPEVGPTERQAYWDRISAAHQAWKAAVAQPRAESTAPAAAVSA